jgi:flavin-binding protein dodecin
MKVSEFIEFELAAVTESAAKAKASVRKVNLFFNVDDRGDVVSVSGNKVDVQIEFPSPSAVVAAVDS